MSELNGRLDEAARAGWLYYIAGKTQDDIARTLNVSRPTAQRLVSLCRAEGLDHVPHRSSGQRVHAPRRATERALSGWCIATSSRPTAPTRRRRSPASRRRRPSVMERMPARATDPLVMGLGTGRSMRASVERVTPDAATAAPASCRWSARSRRTARRAASTRRSSLAELTRRAAFPDAAADARHPRVAQREPAARASSAVRRIFAMAQEADVWFSGHQPDRRGRRALARRLHHAATSCSS